MRFQPRSADFQKAVGEVMEHALQASMFTHSTLTEGEWVQIAHEGAVHDVKVLTLQPEAAVSIIGKFLNLAVVLSKHPCIHSLYLVSSFCSVLFCVALCVVSEL